MKPSSILRVVVGAIALTVGPGVLSASCTNRDIQVVPVPDGFGDDASQTDVHVPAMPSPTCAPPSGAASRCTGSDPSTTFYPALQCASLDAGASDDGASDAGDAGDGGNPCFGISPYDTYFTPTACQAFAVAEASGLIDANGGTRAPTWQAPMDGAMLTPDEWSIFAWDKGATARRGPLDDVLDLLEPSAHAFTPLAGDAYVIEFTVDCKEILRVMISVTAWLPDPASWAILTAQTRPVVARITWMKFVNDALAPGTKPVVSAPITFSMSH